VERVDLVTRWQLRLRAQIVLAAADGVANAAIAARVQVCVDTVRKWHKRFAAKGSAGLRDGERSGRPRRITALERAEVTALACALPAEATDFDCERRDWDTRAQDTLVLLVVVDEYAGIDPIDGIAVQAARFAA
jgi:transposase